MHRLTLALIFLSTAFAQAQMAPQWEPMGPFGGSAAVVQVDPKHPGTVVAATNNGLFFRSRNNGESWSPVSFPAQLRSTLHTFAITPDGIYYAGLSSDTPELAGLYRSTDQGSSWETLPGLVRKEIWSIAIWAGDAKTIAVGTRDGVYRTVDGGAAWEHISPNDNEEMAPVVSLAIDPKNASAIYAGTPHLPWKTIDGGATWRSIHEGMLDDSDVFSIHIDSSQTQRVFASACSGIYRSENAGSGWSKMRGAQGASYRTYIITQDPLRPELVYAGTTSGLAKSSDGGVTWRRISPDATRWIAFDPATPGRMFFAADEAGISRSDDGGETIQATNKGFCNRQLPALTWTGTAAVTASIYEPSHGGIFELKADAAAWQRIAPSSELPVQVLKLESAPSAIDTKLFASSYDSLLSSTDGGRKWSPSAGPKGAKVSVFLGTANGLYAATDSGLFRNETGSKTWSRVAGPFGSQKIKVLSSLGGSRLALATSSAVYVSENGITWTTTAPVPNDATVNVIGSAGGRRILAGTNSGLIRSEDFGASWEPLFWGLSQSSVSSMRQHPEQPDTIFVAQYGVVYRSENGGETWVRVSPDRASNGTGVFIDLETIKALAVLPGSPDRLLALTQSQGTFALPLSASPTAARQKTTVTGKIGKNSTAQ